MSPMKVLKNRCNEIKFGETLAKKIGIIVRELMGYPYSAQSALTLGGSGGMPPQEIFEK